MNKKLSLQIIIIFMAIVFSVFFFNKIYSKKDIEILENKEFSKFDEKNLIEGIQYYSKDLKGNTYLIEAENGIMDQNNQDIIFLKNVKAKINFDEKKIITVNSERAIYNISNFDTEFLDNVKLEYDENKLSCDKILAKFSQNYAILSGNLEFKSLITKLYADQMEVDLIARTTKTSMFDENNKIKIKQLTNGVN
jgi:lipopolysaccharide export system protein LptA